FHPTEQSFLTADRDGLVRLWQIAPGSNLLTRNTGGWVRAIAFSPDGSMLARGSSQSHETQIRFLDMDTKRLTRPPIIMPRYDPRDDNWIEGLAFAPDGKSIWSCLRQEAILQRWDMTTHKVLQTIATHQGEP